MLRYAFVYGGLSGAIIIGVMTFCFYLSGNKGAATSMWLGYLVMILMLSLIFVGVKRYRDKENGGVIRFWPALGLGLAMAAVAGAAYALVWEAYLAAIDYTFIESYTAGVIEMKKAKGLHGAALQAEIDKMAAFAESYANPFFRIPVSFLELFPVGLVVALISAAILRNPKAFPARA